MKGFLLSCAASLLAMVFVALVVLLQIKLERADARADHWLCRYTAVVADSGARFCPEDAQ